METLFLNLLSLTGPVSALIALLLALTPFMRKSYAAKWRQYMWTFCAVRLLLPVKLFSSSLYTVELPQKTSAVLNAAPSEQGVKLITALSAIWLAGAVIFISAQTVSYIAFRRNVKRRSDICPSDELMNIFISSKAAMGIKGNISLRICKTLGSPMVTGFIRPVLLLPHAEYGAQEAEIIIRHELIHFKKRHLWCKLLLLLTEAVSWFNPFVYAMFRAADKDMELACDDEVIRGCGYEFRQRYCETILNGIHREGRRANTLTTCLNVNKKMLLDRFKNILNTGVKRNGVLICLAVSVSLVAGSAVVSFAEGKVSDELSEVFDYTPRPIIPPAPAPSEPPKYETDYEPDYGEQEYVPEPQSEPEEDTGYNEPEYVPESDYAAEPDYEPAPDYVPESDYVPETPVEAAEPYSVGEADKAGSYADISIDESRSFEGEEITEDNSRTITVETKDGEASGDSFTAYIRAGEDGYEMVRTEE